MKPAKTITRTVTQNQWDKYLPAKTLANYLRKFADSLDILPDDVRGKIKMQVEVGRPTKE